MVPLFWFLAACAPAPTEHRIATIETILRTERARMEVWSYTWGSIYATAAVAQAAVLPVVNSDTRATLAVGTGSAAFGALSLFLIPLRVTMPIASLDKRWNDTDRCRLLADAEYVLSRTADAERQATGWIGHLGNIVFNIGLVVLLGAVLHQWQSALISGGVGVVVGELNLITQPNGLTAYR